MCIELVLSKASEPKDKRIYIKGTYKIKQALNNILPLDLDSKLKDELWNYLTKPNGPINSIRPLSQYLNIELPNFNI